MTEHADLGFTAMGAAEDSYPSSYLDTSLFHFGFPASEQAFSCAGLPSLFSSDTPVSKPGSADDHSSTY